MRCGRESVAVAIGASLLALLGTVGCHHTHQEVGPGDSGPV